MSNERLEDWISEQLSIIQDGLAIRSIRIEEDEILWSTILVTDEHVQEPSELVTKVTNALENIVKGLHVGRHLLRLVSTNAEGHPVSTFQHIVSGNAPGKKAPAVDESIGRLIQSLTETVQKVLDSNTERNTVLEQTNTMLYKSLNEMHEAALLQQQHFAKLSSSQLDKEAKREALKTIVDQCAPVGALLLGEAVSYFETKNKLMKAQMEALEAKSKNVQAETHAERSLVAPDENSNGQAATQIVRRSRGRTKKKDAPGSKEHDSSGSSG
jgi:hypothetical protein